MAFVQIDQNGAVVTIFGCHQNDPTPPGYAEIDDDDPRLALFVAGASVPGSVTPAQAHIALSRAGLLDTVNSAIAALSGQDGIEVQIWWAKAEEIRRDNPHLASVAVGLGLSSDQVDDLFRTAATIS